MSHLDCATEISDNLAPIIALLDGNFVLTNCWVPKHNFPPHNIDLVILPSQENNIEWICEVIWVIKVNWKWLVKVMIST